MLLIQIVYFFYFPFPSFQACMGLSGCGFIGLIIHQAPQVQCRNIARSVTFPAKPTPFGTRVIFKCTTSVGTSASHTLWGIEAEYVCESSEVEGLGLVLLFCSFLPCQGQDLSNQMNLIYCSQKSMGSGVSFSNWSLSVLVASCIKMS